MKKISLPFFIALFSVIASHCFATSKPYTFLLLSNRIIVETGSYMGDGILNALCGGAQEIHSIELSPKYYFFCKERFAKKSNVHIHLGNSATTLFEVIQDIDEPITFWLDAQFSGFDMAYGGKMTPILDELEQIKRHHIKNHTILIDDVRQFGTWYFGDITKEQIIEKIYEINPNYSISYSDGFVPADILVAEIH